MSLFKKKNLIIFIGIISVYSYGFFKGEYLVDDWTIYEISKLDFINSYKSIIGAFYNRPFLPLFLSIFSQLFSYSFKIQYLFNIFIIGLSSFIILKSLKDYLSNSLIKFFSLILLFFPIFSYTNILSPGMQISGNISILIWSISFAFLKKYLLNFKKIDFIISSILISILILTYESALPLIGVHISFLIYDQKTIKKKVIDILFLALCIFLGFFIQNIFLPDNSDLSRIRINNISISYIFKNFIINCSLLVNIFFSFIDLILIILKDSYLYIIITVFIAFLISYFYKINFYKVNFKKNKIILSIILSTFLLILMHIVSESKIFFYGYGNRSLASFSVILTFIAIFFSEKLVFNKQFKIISIIIFLLVPLALLYIQIQNYQFSRDLKNKIYRAENLILLNTNEQILKEKKIITYIYINEFKDNEFYKITYDIENFDLRRLSKYKYENFRGYDLNPHKFCNKNTWDLYYKNYILNSIKESEVVILIYYDNVKIKIKGDDNMLNEIKNFYDCDYFKTDYLRNINFMLKRLYNFNQNEIQNARMELQKNFFLEIIAKTFYDIFSK